MMLTSPIANLVCCIHPNIAVSNKNPVDSCCHNHSYYPPFQPPTPYTHPPPLPSANAISAGALLHTGLSRLAPTHDLNAAQVIGLADLLGSKGREKLEVILHQHLAVFQ